MNVGDTMHLSKPVRDSSGRTHARGDAVRIERIIAHDGAGEHRLILVLPLEPFIVTYRTSSRFYCYENELAACECEAGDAS